MFATLFGLFGFWDSCLLMMICLGFGLSLLLKSIVRSEATKEVAAKGILMGIEKLFKH